MQELQLVLSTDDLTGYLTSQCWVVCGQALTAGCCSTCVWPPANRCCSRNKTDTMPKSATFT